MNYQDIPFFIWAKDSEHSTSIGKILGRRYNTHISYGDPAPLYEYLDNTEFFTCYVFHFEEKTPDSLEDLIHTTQKKCPLSPIVLFSFKKVSDSWYRNSIRSGISDILVYNEMDDHISLRKSLLQVLNQKWKAYRHFETEKKKILQATVVTAHHEINQPLTVIMNSVGMLNMEIEKLRLKVPSSEKFFKLVIKAVNRIQDILVRLKKIENPQLKEYTKGVPMINLDEINEEEDTQTIFIEKKKKKTVLIIDHNIDIHKQIAQVIQEEDYNALFCTNGTDAIRIIKEMKYRIDIVLLNVEISSVEIGELMFQLRIHTINTPIILLSKSGETARVHKFIREGANSYLPIPFNAKQLRTAVAKKSIC
jgi:CheY-like chemotaxis protein